MSIKELFPPLEPYNHFLLAVDDLHQIYVEESGNPNGAPVVYLHGGPGVGCGDWARRFLDPDFYRIICIDQRGCGRSLPFLELRQNTTEDLAKDLEEVRQHLNIEQWLVHGGSWGTTLALYYAEQFPRSVKGLILRGIFLARKEDMDWLYQGGAGQFFPEAYEDFCSLLTAEEQKDNVSSYYKYLTSSDRETRLTYAKAFSSFENTVIYLHPDDVTEEISDEDVAMATMESHYFVNDCFLEENQLLRDAYKIKEIPTKIIHGRYDVDCRPSGAKELFDCLENAELTYTISGHSSSEPEIIDALIRAQEDFKEEVSW
ncbi:prolyl aminopeptidase [Streptococcus loxodontisalivarius]|uniref:Proline iminopeptidase n=1 Tax=Streptococcus loxodontisalivarius TaxID=1349415 RepID=A0ABS2PSV1_9STRE|nr:prolyl aminopeptidase [Streptococcus loxodontisalivarius]MBM7643122.1 proline iminopeptidase [Streptococcus loxodontisalivarius]